MSEICIGTFEALLLGIFVLFIVLVLVGWRGLE